MASCQTQSGSSCDLFFVRFIGTTKVIDDGSAIYRATNGPIQFRFRFDSMDSLTCTARDRGQGGLYVNRLYVKCRRSVMQLILFWMDLVTPTKSNCWNNGCLFFYQANRLFPALWIATIIIPADSTGAVTWTGTPVDSHLRVWCVLVLRRCVNFWSIKQSIEWSLGRIVFAYCASVESYVKNVLVLPVHHTA